MAGKFSFEVPAVAAPKGFPAINTIKNILHIIQALATFIVLCIIATVIATEYRFYDGSQPGPNWTLFVGIFGLGVPVCLVVFPWIYDKNGKFRRLGKFCMKPRTNLIFTGFYTGLWATTGIAMTVHANNPSHCNLDGEMAEADGDYTSAWTTQCTNAKVAAGFAWTICILWLLSLLCTLIIFFREKQMIQKNLRQHESNKQAVLQMQQQQEMEDGDDMYNEPIGAGGRNSGYRSAGYYEDEEGEDLGRMRPQSFEQARPLQETTPPPHLMQQQQPHREQSPFESPYDPPTDSHRVSYGYAQPPQHAQQVQQPQYDPHPGGAAIVQEQSPFDDMYRHPSPDPAQAYNPSPSPPQHHVAGTSPAPMAMPDHTQYSNPAPYNTGSPDPNARF
ncbi:hypothetical protein BDC45DRAFT_606911 [Circinella umbellata]|nr:hypothetical protein BDC45DRAFT_606911 [Circinella umbellata]